MARVFISFVHEDKRIAEAVQRLLAKELDLKDEVFLSADQSQVLAGDIWLDKIRSALEQCEALVLMLSSRSLRRAWVNFEAGAVWLSRRPVIPVCFGNVSKGALPQPYAGMQAVDISQDAYYLVKSVYEHLKLGGPPPPPPRLRRIAQAVVSEKEERRPFLLTGPAFDAYEWLEKALADWQDELPRRRLPPES